MLTQVLKLLRDTQATLSFAESCTGGRLSATLTERAGVSDVFLGSVVSYSNQVKMDLLGVSPVSLKNEGAVSETIARQMAQGCRSRLHSTWSLAITGIAGPTGGSPDKPVGLIWFAVSGTDFEGAWQKQFSGSRSEVQIQSVDFALALLVDCLKNKNEKIN